MNTVDIINADNKKQGQAQVSESLFEKKVNKAVLYQAVKTHLASKHHGTHKVKSRGEIRGTTQKVYRQKGTGNARHGNKKAPLYKGGGVAFGPKPRSHVLGLNKKVKRLALKEAFKQKLLDKDVIVVDDFGLSEIKTKKAKELLTKLNIDNALVVADEMGVVVKSMRNIPRIRPVLVDQLTVFDLLKFKKVVFSSQSFEKTKEKLAV